MPKSELTTHAVGALALCSVVLVAVALMATAGSTVASAIRWVAFFADFQYASGEPVLTTGGSIRLWHSPVATGAAVARRYDWLDA